MQRPHVIVFGNEKGGSGKSTTAMHVAAALLSVGQRVGAIDLDLRQQTLRRYLENRLTQVERRSVQLPMPVYARVRSSEATDRKVAEQEEVANVRAALQRLAQKRCTFIVIDCPGTDTVVSRAAHMLADTIVTPINDSFIDFDMLGHVDPDSGQVIEPSLYAEMVWDSRKRRAMQDSGKIDWVVMRNRMSVLNAQSGEQLGRSLDALAKRIGFRIAPGFTERVIYRELFLRGLTLLDLGDPGTGVAMNMSHVAARQEVRGLLTALDLPNVAGFASAAE